MLANHTSIATVSRPSSMMSIWLTDVEAFQTYRKTI